MCSHTGPRNSMIARSRRSGETKPTSVDLGELTLDKLKAPGVDDGPEK